MSPRNVEFGALAARIAQRREAILRAWRDLVSADPALTTGASLPRAQLHDHIPALLADFERRLRAGASAATAEVQDGDAAAHGLHRWQQGFDLGEVARELGRLNECMVDELDRCAATDAGQAPGVMAAARRIWAQMHGENVGASTSQYFRLQQIEARSHVQDLEGALEQLRELQQQRAQLWEQAAHDLRGNLGVVATATAGLAIAPATSPVRESFLRVLDRNVAALQHLLNDVTSLARLQGGQEHRELVMVDAAALLRDLCERLQAPTDARQLYLRFDGPPTLAVQADAVKVGRIAQNLVLNAIKYTRQGGVTVSCGVCAGKDDERWFLQVLDTGPGFHAGPGSPLAGALEEATDQARQVAADDRRGTVTHVDGERAEAYPAPGDMRSVYQGPGEGLGLSIVKRLCELLNATLELESTENVGTRVRILLPLRYAD